MKPLNFAIVLMALISCKKVQEETIKPETLAFDKAKIVIFKPVTQSSIITFNYGTKTLPLLFNRTTVGNISNCALADTAGKTVYLTFVINDSTGKITDVNDPNLVPFGNILPIGAEPTWKSCMWNSIKLCVMVPLCNNVACRGEAIIGCLGVWAIACIGHLQVKQIDKVKTHLIDNLPPIKYV